jgi:hypothetical protein
LKKTVISVVILLLFTGNCGNANLSGGSTETVNTRVSASVYLPDNSVVNDAVARLVPSGQNPLKDSCIIFRDTTDNSGQFIIEPEKLKDGYYNLLISSKHMAYFADSIYLKTGSDMELQSIVLKKTGSLKGKVVLENATGEDSVFAVLVGTDLTAISQKDSFSLEDIPEGEYTIHFLTKSNKYASIDTSVSIASGLDDTLSDTVTIPLSTFQLDNFDDGDMFLNYNDKTLGNGWNSFWYFFKESDGGATSEVYPPAPASRDSFGLKVTSDGAYSGKSFYMRVVLANRTSPFAGIACNISSEAGKYANLTSLKSLSFYLKGKGKIRVSFLTKALDRYPSSQQWGTWGKEIVCPAEWEKIVIDNTELVPQAYSAQERDGLTWGKVRDSVDILQFVTSSTAGDTVEIHLDDISLRGVGMTDLK